MKYLSSLCAASLWVAAYPAFAIEPMNGWYTGLMVGASYTTNAKVRVYRPSGLINLTLPVSTPFQVLPRKAKISYNVLMDGGLQAGYRCNHFRYEGEILYNINTYNHITLNGFRLGRTRPRRINRVTPFTTAGSTALLGGFINAYVDFYNEESDNKFLPYLGLGVGYANIRNDIQFAFNNVNLDLSRTNTRNVVKPMGQGIVGLSYLFNDNWSMAVDARYTVSQRIETLDDNVAVAALNILVNYTFDQD